MNSLTPPILLSSRAPAYVYVLIALTLLFTGIAAYIETDGKQVTMIGFLYILLFVFAANLISRHVREEDEDKFFMVSIQGYNTNISRCEEGYYSRDKRIFTFYSGMIFPVRHKWDRHGYKTYVKIEFHGRPTKLGAEEYFAWYNHLMKYKRTREQIVWEVNNLNQSAGFTATIVKKN